MGSLFFFPGSWCTQGSVCALQESVFPVLCKFWWLYGRVNGDLLQKVPCTHCHTQCPLTLVQATADSRLHWRLLDTHGHVWVSFLWGHCSFLLGPGAHKVWFVPSKSVFPQSCVTSGDSMVGLMVTSSKRTYAIPRSAALRALAPVAGHC